MDESTFSTFTLVIYGSIIGEKQAINETLAGTGVRNIVGAGLPQYEDLPPALNGRGQIERG